MKFAICNEMFKDWPLERVLTFARSEGYDGVEIAPFTLAETVNEIPAARRAEIRAAAVATGVEIVGLHWLLVKPEGLYLNHPDDAVRRNTGQYLADLVDFCADIGGDRIVFGSPKQRNVVEGLTYARAWDLAKQVFAGLMSRAAARGITVCIEPLARKTTDFINTVREGRRLVEEIAHPNFQLHLDVLAMRNEERPLDEIIREAGGTVGHVHVNDGGGGMPGSGDTDYSLVVRGLREIGYDDYVSVEVFNFSPGPETIARESLKFLKQAFS